MLALYNIYQKPKDPYINISSNLMLYSIFVNVQLRHIIIDRNICWNPLYPLIECRCTLGFCNISIMHTLQRNLSSYNKSNKCTQMLRFANSSVKQLNIFPAKYPLNTVFI